MRVNTFVNGNGKILRTLSVDLIDLKVDDVIQNIAFIRYFQDCKELLNLGCNLINLMKQNNML